jgi:hypothetical protein
MMMTDNEVHRLKVNEDKEEIYIECLTCSSAWSGHDELRVTDKAENHAEKFVYTTASY